MTQSISRIQFLRGDFRGQRAAVRPPWACNELEFIEKCSRCGECLHHCPEKIISKDKYGYPQIDFSKGECLLCHACVDQCEPEALSQDLAKLPWSLRAEVTERCIVYQGIHCMVCREQCEPEAITFTHKPGLPPRPHIEAALCNGCGACYKPCPGQAINLAYQENQKNQHKENAS